MSKFNFTIRELMGVCLILALFLAWWITRSELVSVKDTLHRERDDAGYIFETPKIISLSGRSSAISDGQNGISG